MQFEQSPHRRRNPLTGQWVLVSPHRNNRPWLGASEKAQVKDSKSYDESCPLCPNNERANGVSNPDFKQTFVFKNDFGAINDMPADVINEQDTDELFVAQSARGECRVVCYSPNHDETLPEMSVAAIEAVVDCWQEQFTELSQDYACVHIFENKGQIMGCSQPHPHGQIWAHDYHSTEIATKNVHLKAYLDKHQSNLLGDYVAKELIAKDRVIIDNPHWLVVVPFWAAWPFETLVVAKDDVTNMSQLTSEQKQCLAKTLQELTIRYDNVFNCSFPYSMGWHNAPSDLDDDSHWRLHGHFYPPLLRSATVKKHMVGYEMLAESQRDLTAEKAADILRGVSDIHYAKETS